MPRNGVEIVIELSGVKTKRSRKNNKRRGMGKDLWNCRKLDLVCEGKGDAEGEGVKYGSS